MRFAAFPREPSSAPECMTDGSSIRHRAPPPDHVGHYTFIEACLIGTPQ
jgi:hypothetical protein